MLLRVGKRRLNRSRHAGPGKIPSLAAPTQHQLLHLLHLPQLTAYTRLHHKAASHQARAITKNRHTLAVTNYTLRPGEQGKYNTMNYDRTKVGGGWAHVNTVFLFYRVNNGMRHGCGVDAATCIIFFVIFCFLLCRFTLPAYTTALLCGCVGVCLQYL